MDLIANKMESIFAIDDNKPTNNCNQITNKTSIFTSAYNGIPETLILNVILWFLLIFLFTVLRHKVGDYGRLALVNSNDGSKKRWTDVFYSAANGLDATQPVTPSSSSGLRIGGTMYGSDMPRGSVSSSGSTETNHLPNNNIHPEQGLFSWIKITFKIRKEQILLHTGPDAVHYLSFQQHLMMVMAIVTAISLVIILPVNFLNGPEDVPYDVHSFARTTMANLPADSAWQWVHTFIAIAYVPLCVLIMRRASGRNAFKRAATRTIMITHISSSDRNRTVVRNYIQELFPNVTIEDVQIAYNISKLYDRNEEYERALEARIYCEHHRNRDTLNVKAHACACRGKENAYVYYQREERKLSGDVARLRAAALNEPLGIAFITVSTVNEAQDIVSHFTPGTYRQWHLSFAPSPDDLFWENLNVSKQRWYIKWATVNVILFVVLFFLTTPAIVVNFISNVSGVQNGTVSPLVSEFLPTLMLWTLSALMPVIVAFSDKWLAHYTRSLQNYSIMTKCFGYLLLMILILPSLGLTSAQALLEWSVSNETARWECIFLPDRGSFYVNYVITAAFIGTSLELLRFPELIVYLWELCTAKSKAETPHIRKSILIEFPFGIHYAWTVMVFTICIVYSVFCPLIMPFAMIYICLKHFVDRHNLYFAYGPSNMISRNGGKIHSTAVTMTKFSVVIQLLIMAMISVVRGYNTGMGRTVVLLVALIITLTLFTFMSPIKRCTSVRRPSIVDVAGPAPLYVPEVLKPRTHFGAASPLTRHNGGGNSGGGGGSGSGVADSGISATSTAGNGVQGVVRDGSGAVTGYGSDSVSDYDISSQCSVNSVDA